MNEQTLNDAKQWFESLGFSVDISFGSMYLQLECCSVELSHSEIECRAEQWINHLNREN